MDDDTLRFALEPLRPEESELAFRDELTGLYNRRLLSNLLDNRWNELTSLVDRFSLLMIDLDLFKEVNDRYGHLSGDEVLRVTAQLLQRYFRKGDFVFRYGGDEFVILLPGAGPEEARQLAERARSAMASHEFFTHEEKQRIDVPISFCVGVATYPNDGTSSAALLSWADILLYEEKRRVRGTRKAWRTGIPRLAAVTVIASLPVIAFLLWQRDLEVRAIPPPSEPAALPPSEIEKRRERDILLEQIEQLQARIQSLEVERGSREPADDSSGSPELERLREEVKRLTAQLDTRPAVEPSTPADTGAPSAEPGRASGGTTTPPSPTESNAETAGGQSAAPGQPAPVVTPPKLLRPVTPKYPSLAQRLGREATIELIVRVDTRGRVIHARVIGERTGFGFEKAAMDAALLSTWQPGTQNGQPVEMETPLRIAFQVPPNR